MMVLLNVRATLLKADVCHRVARYRNAAEHWCSPPQALVMDHSFIRTLRPPSHPKTQRKKTYPKQYQADLIAFYDLELSAPVN